MTIRAGAYAVSTFRGTIREDSYPIAVCTHSHDTKPLAAQCARTALSAVKEAWGKPDGRPPVGWRWYR